MKAYDIDQKGHQYTRHEQVDMSMLAPIARLMEGKDEGRRLIFESMLPRIAGFHSSCAMCDAWTSLIFDHEAKTITAKTECPFKDGITTTFQVGIPSGVMVVANDLRDVFGVPREFGDGMASYNSHMGQSEFMLGIATHFGFAYGPVGNTSPGLYRTATGYEIANPAYDEDTDEWLEEDNNPLLAQVITDLWAYCIADARAFQAAQSRSIQAGHGPFQGQYTMVPVEPGTYEFVHHTGELDFKDTYDTNDRVIYTTIRKI